MTNKTEHYKVRLPSGVVVVMTELELYGQDKGLKLHKVHRRKCTFLPGVNPAYDATLSLTVNAERVRKCRERKAGVSIAKSEARLGTDRAR